MRLSKGQFAGFFVPHPVLNRDSLHGGLTHGLPHGLFHQEVPVDPPIEQSILPIENYLSDEIEKRLECFFSGGKFPSRSKFDPRLPSLLIGTDRSAKATSKSALTGS